MTIENVLSRLSKVKKTGKDKWLACCSAHQDKSPSLAIKLESDGRILLHCFAGCSADDVIAAIGLEFSELFPEKLMEHGKPVRKPYHAGDVLEALITEIHIVSMMADRMYHKKDMTLGDWERLKIASNRILAAKELIDHG